MEDLASLVKTARTAAHLTQPQLAQRAGVAYRTVQRLEEGERVRATIVGKISRALGLGLAQEKTLGGGATEARQFDAADGLRPVSLEEAGVLLDWRRLSLEGRAAVRRAMDAAISADHASATGAEGGGRASG